MWIRWKDFRRLLFLVAGRGAWSAAGWAPGGGRGETRNNRLAGRRRVGHQQPATQHTKYVATRTPNTSRNRTPPNRTHPPPGPPPAIPRYLMSPLSSLGVRRVPGCVDVVHTYAHSLRKSLLIEHPDSLRFARVSAAKTSHPGSFCASRLRMVLTTLPFSIKYYILY